MVPEHQTKELFLTFCHSKKDASIYCYFARHVKQFLQQRQAQHGVLADHVIQILANWWKDSELMLNVFSSVDSSQIIPRSTFLITDNGKCYQVAGAPFSEVSGDQLITWRATPAFFSGGNTWLGLSQPWVERLVHIALTHRINVGISTVSSHMSSIMLSNLHSLPMLATRYQP